MNKSKILLPSYTLGLALREMAECLMPRKTIKMIQLPPEKIEEGRKIMERMKMKTAIVKPAHTMTMAPSKSFHYEELTLVESKTIYPLKRDPKTGRMIKAERTT